MHDLKGMISPRYQYTEFPSKKVLTKMVAVGKPTATSGSGLDGNRTRSQGFASPGAAFTLRAHFVKTLHKDFVAVQENSG